VGFWDARLKGYVRDRSSSYRDWDGFLPWGCSSGGSSLHQALARLLQRLDLSLDVVGILQVGNTAYLGPLQALGRAGPCEACLPPIWREHLRGEGTNLLRPDLVFG